MQVTFPKYGFTAPSAYLKIGNAIISYHADGWNLGFDLKVYFSSTAKNNGKAPIEVKRYIMDYSTSSGSQDQYNAIKAGYEYLKTLTEFSGATDV